MIDKEAFEKAIKEHDTPLFIFDADELRERAGRIRAILSGGESGIGFCYSIKANPFLIPYLMGEVDAFEVCSPGELEICRRYKVPGGMIIYSGVHKESKDIRAAVSYGAKVLTAESIRHYELIRDVAKEMGEVDVILRLSAKSQFGMSLEDIEEVLRENKSDPSSKVNILGLHYFAGTQREKLKHQREELEMLRGVLADLRSRYDMPLELLEYGPGLGYPYFEGDDFSDTLQPLKELANDLYDAAGDCRLTVEMGRFLVSSCGYYLTRVCDKKRSYDHNWCIVDGGLHHVNYLGHMMGLKTPVIIRVPARSMDKRADVDNRDNAVGHINAYGLETADAQDAGRDKEEWSLCGSLCTTNDVLARSYKMSEPELGDMLVFCHIGAYAVTEAMNLFLSRDMPAVLIYEKGTFHKVRDVIETWRLNS